LEELVSGLLRPKLFPFGKLSKAKSAAQVLFWHLNDPGSGMEKKSKSGMKIPDLIFENLASVFGLKNT
jgi:hypothetical protein